MPQTGDPVDTGLMQQPGDASGTTRDRSPFGMASRPEKLAAAVKRWKELRGTCNRHTGMCYTCKRCAFEACPFVAWWVRKGYAEARGLEYASTRTGDWYG